MFLLEFCCKYVLYTDIHNPHVNMYQYTHIHTHTLGHSPISKAETLSKKHLNMLEYKYSNIIKMELNSFSGQCYFNLILLANVQVASEYSKCRCIFC